MKNHTMPNPSTLIQTNAIKSRRVEADKRASAAGDSMGEATANESPKIMLRAPFIPAGRVHSNRALRRLQGRPAFLKKFDKPAPALEPLVYAWPIVVLLDC